MKHRDPQGDPPSPDQLRELLDRYRLHGRAQLGGERDCLGCGSSIHGKGRWWFSQCSYSGVEIDGRFHSHVPKPYGCGGPDEGCPEPERHESIEVSWSEVRDLLARDQLAFSL
jgi:hypothetical protein